MAQLLLGIGAIVLGGILAGLYTTPMRMVKGWAWENVCFIYCIYGLVLFPWIVVFFSVDDAINVYREAPVDAMAKAVGMGAVWGVGSTLFCLGVDALGSGLAFSIILGLTSGLGAAVPLVVLHPRDITSNEGILTWVGMGVILIGLVFLGRAGKQKELEQRLSPGPTKEMRGVLCVDPVMDVETPLLVNNSHSEGPKYANASPTSSSQLPKQEENGTSSQPTNGEEIQSSAISAVAATEPLPSSSPYSFRTGLVICIFSGVFSPALNFGLTFGSDVMDTAQRLGTPKSLANNATWALVVSGGFVPNILWWSYEMTRNKTWHKFLCSPPEATPLRNASIGAGAGALWFFGNVLYGVGGQLVGNLGTVIGFPIFLSFMIITSSMAGVAIGEWKGTQRLSRVQMLLGLLLLLVAVVIIGIGPAL